MQGFDIYNLKTCEKVHREYLKIGQFHNGIAQFQGLDGKWGFINDELSVIMPSRFPRVYEFTKKGVWVESIDGKKTHLNF